MNTVEALRDALAANPKTREILAVTTTRVLYEGTDEVSHVIRTYVAGEHGVMLASNGAARRWRTGDGAYSEDLSGDDSAASYADRLVRHALGPKEAVVTTVDLLRAALAANPETREILAVTTGQVNPDRQDEVPYSTRTYCADGERVVVHAYDGAAYGGGVHVSRDGSEQYLTGMHASSAARDLCDRVLPA